MAMMTTMEKILAKAEALEAQAAALRLAVTILNGDLTAKKRLAVAQTISQAMKIRHAQKNGGPPAAEAAPVPRQSKWQRTNSRREKKREQILEIVKAYGKPMPVKLLAEAARKRGVKSLTGITGTVRAGYLKQTGRKGDTHYSIPS